MGLGAVRRVALACCIILPVLGCRHSETAPSASKPSGGGPFDPLFPVHHDYPAWSAGGVIAYEDFGIVCVDSLSGGFLPDTTLAGLWIVNPSTGDKHRLLPTGTMPAWSRDGNRLAVVIGSSIFTMNVDGSGLTWLTSGGSNLFPSWNMDATWIAFQGNVSTSPNVRIMRADGSENQIAGTAEGRYPCWSPVEPLILYAGSFGSVPGELCTIDERLRFLNPTRLTNDQADDREPDYSPDGRQIAFSSQWRQGNIESGTARVSLPQIWIMNSDGTGVRQLTQNGGRHPSWSPDGSKIVYTRYDWRLNTPENGVLWVIDLTTGTESQLTFKWPCSTSVAHVSWTDVKQKFR
jgi:TolB protein